jgi:resuscitation-promoting factor RpfA
MSRGRHCKMSTTGQNVVRVSAEVVLATTLSAATLSLVPTSAFAATPPSAALEIIAECESSNSIIPESTGTTTASGYWQIVNGTWRAYGGEEFAPRAIGASRDEQLTIAQRIVAQRGSYADWDASKACWGSKISGKSSDGADDTDAPAPARTHKKRVITTDDVYVVRDGDTLSAIAAAHGTTWQAIFAANRDVIGDPDLIHASERLRV